MVRHNKFISYFLAAIFSIPLGILITSVLLYFASFAFNGVPKIVFTSIALFGLFMAATFISMIAEAKLNFGAVALTLAIGAFYLISQNYPSSRYNLVIFFSLAFIAASVFMNAGKAERLCQSADAVLAIHALQVIMLLISAFVSIWLRQLRVYIAVMALSGFFIWKFFGWCPATFLEQKLRKIRGEKINFEEKGCIGHYIGKWLGLEVSAKKVEMSTYVLEALLFAWWGIDFLLF